MKGRAIALWILAIALPLAIEVSRQLAPHLPATAGRTVIAEGTNSEFASAIDDLLDEQVTIDSRLLDAINTSYYGYKFFLPSEAYHRHQAAVSARSSDAREVLGEVYVQADALNEKFPGGTSDGIEMEYVTSPDPVRLRKSFPARKPHSANYAPEHFPSDRLCRWPTTSTNAPSTAAAAVFSASRRS